MSFPKHLDFLENKRVVHHYWQAATGSHWLLCDVVSLEWDVWNGFVLMPHLDQDGQWGPIEKSELDEATKKGSLVTIFQKLKAPEMLGNFRSVVKNTNMFPKKRANHKY